MKKISFMIAALLVAMTGCQKEPQVNPENNPGSNAETVGYVALKISLPSSTGTKAETFHQGSEPFEWAVNNIIAVFYDDEGEYQFHVPVNGDPWNKNSTTTAEITLSGKSQAIPVPAGKVAEKALVLVNVNNDMITDFNKDYKTLIETAIATDVTGIIGVIEGDSKAPSFFMSNAPFYDAETGKFTTLVSVVTATTETQALAVAKNVQVERAAAKVTLEYDDVEPYVDDNGNKAYIEGWNLDVTNKSFYPVRHGFDNPSVSGNEWFISKNQPVNDALLGSRIYWAVDPNYAEGWYADDSELEAAFNRVAESDFADKVVAGNLDHRYCLENTFNIWNMNENQTTTVMLKVTYVPEGINKGDTWLMVGSSKQIMSLQEFEDYVIARAKELQGINAPSIVPGDFSDDNSTLYKAGDITDEPLLDHTVEYYAGQVICFKKGVCYYPVKVRHFSDDDLQYTASEFQDSFIANNGYVARDLGRYGVLRNTWYQININSIKNPGSPVIPDPTDNPDDKFEQFVACTIDILAWSVRNHSVDL